MICEHCGGELELWLVDDFEEHYKCVSCGEITIIDFE